jgi:hypothetical protein
LGVLGGRFDREIFLEQARANFSEKAFGLVFAGPPGIWTIRRKLPVKILRNQAIFRRHCKKEPKFLFLKIANKLPREIRILVRKLQ